MHDPEFPGKLYRIRKHLDLSQLYLAECLGLTPEAYGKIERGKTRLTLQRLEQIAPLFGLEIWELIKLSSDELILLLIERKKQTPDG